MKHITKLEQENQQLKVDNWNLKYKPGTPAILTKDDGSKFETATRSEAWMVCGHGCVLVNGISGGYSLDRIEAK